MKPALALKVNGSVFQMRPPTALTLAIKAFLDRAPKDELFTVQGLAQRLKASREAISYRDLFERPELAAYSLKVRHIRYWGHPRAIAELRKQVDL